MKRESRLHFIEHCNVSIKQTDNLVKMRIVALNNGSNVFQSLLAFDFGSPDNIMFLLLCSIKPTEEQTRTLSLLTAVHTADVKQNIGVFPEKLFNDTNNSLRYLFVSRRGCIVQIGQVKPISNIIWICIIIERHGIIYSVICSKDNGSIFIISDIVRCAVIDINNIKFVHRLHPFKIVIPRFCSLFLATLTFCIFRLSLLHPPFLYLSSTLQQSQKVRTRPFLYIICCVHNLILFFFQRQSYE